MNFTCDREKEITNKIEDLDKQYWEEFLQGSKRYERIEEEIITLNKELEEIRKSNMETELLRMEREIDFLDESRRIWEQLFEGTNADRSSYEYLCERLHKLRIERDNLKSKYSLQYLWKRTINSDHRPY